jgi:hypothetical protein
MSRIEADISPSGYTLFTVGGKPVLAYQKIDRKHVLIPNGRPSGMIQDADQASRAILTILKEMGGNVHEFVHRKTTNFNCQHRRIK